MTDHDTADRALVEALKRSAAWLEKQSLYHERDVMEDAADALARRIAEGERLNQTLETLHGAVASMPYRTEQRTLYVQRSTVLDFIEAEIEKLSPVAEEPTRYTQPEHTCHGGMNPPFPGPCAACEAEEPTR